MPIHVAQGSRQGNRGTNMHRINPRKAWERDVPVQEMKPRASYPGCMYSQKWTLEWLKMSECRFRLWKHWGDSTMPTSSPLSKNTRVFRKNSLEQTCNPKSTPQNLQEIDNLGQPDEFGVELDDTVTVKLGFHTGIKQQDAKPTNWAVSLQYRVKVEWFAMQSISARLTTQPQSEALSRTKLQWN